MKKILNIFVVLLTTATGLAQQRVMIGNQEWMNHNLSVTTYRNGDIIPQVADPVQWASLTTGAWCYVNNDPATNAVYGKLYNWYAVHDPRGLAPIRWHIPTTTEWTVLTTYLGGNTIAGGKLKTTGTSLWNSPNVITSPNSFFNAVPAGFRYGTSSTSAFRQPGVSAYFWTNNSSSGYAYVTYILNLQADIISTMVEKRRGCTVRCIADPPPPIPPNKTNTIVTKNCPEAVFFNHKTWSAFIFRSGFVVAGNYKTGIDFWLNAFQPDGYTTRPGLWRHVQ